MPKDLQDSFNTNNIIKISWEDIKKQLEPGNQLHKNNRLLSKEQTQKILRDRAKAFAKEPTDTAGTGNTIEVIQFSLAYEAYGIETLYVREVFPLKELTPLPSTPAFLLGITNVRGKIFPVMDIKKFFNLPEKGLTDLNKLIILHNENLELAVLADLITGVTYVDLSALQPPMPTLTGIRIDFLKGVTTNGVIILDGNKILTDNKIIVNDEF